MLGFAVTNNCLCFLKLAVLSHQLFIKIILPDNHKLISFIVDAFIDLTINKKTSSKIKDTFIFFPAADGVCVSSNCLRINHSSFTQHSICEISTSLTSFSGFASNTKILTKNQRLLRLGFYDQIDGYLLMLRIYCDF